MAYEVMTIEDQPALTTPLSPVASFDLVGRLIDETTRSGPERLDDAAIQPSHVRTDR